MHANISGKRKKKLQRWRRKAGEMSGKQGGKESFLFLSVLFVFRLWLPYLCICVNCKSFWPALYGRWWICCIQEIKSASLPGCALPIGLPGNDNKGLFLSHLHISAPLSTGDRDEHREHKARANYCHLWHTGAWQTQRHRNVKQRERRLSGRFWDTWSVGTIDVKRAGRNQVMGDFGCKTWRALRGFHEAMNTWQDMFPGQT